MIVHWDPTASTPVWIYLVTSTGRHRGFSVVHILVLSEDQTITRPLPEFITPPRFWPSRSLYGKAMRIVIELNWFVLPRG